MIKDKLSVLFMIVSYMILVSCQDNSSFMPINEIKSKIKNIITKTSEPSFLRTKKIGEFRFSAIYKPSDLIIRFEETHIAKSKNDFENLNQSLYFQIDIEHIIFSDELLKYNLSSYQQYDERVKYCSFDMIRDVSLIYENDTIPCALHHFERSFNLDSKATFLFAFPLSSNIVLSDVTLMYYDNLFDNGIVKFHFPKELFNSDRYKS